MSLHYQIWRNLMHKSVFTLSPGEINTRCRTSNGLLISLSGSKSYTNRALLAASIADGLSILHNASPSDDSHYLIEALEKIGIKVIDDDSSLRVFGCGGKFIPYNGKIDVGPAGTTMRFLTALLSAIPGCDVILSGSERMHKRPIGTLVDALKKLGADIEYTGDNGCPPLRIKGKNLTGGNIRMKASESSQYLTSLLLISPLLESELTISVSAEQVSTSYIDMTCSCMEEFGINVHREDSLYSVDKNQTYVSREYIVEGDATGAGYFWGLAAIAGGYIRVAPFSFDSYQGDMQLPRFLEGMGCEISAGVDDGAPWVGVKGPAELNSIKCDMTLLPDSAQTLATVAAFANGESTITGLKTLRIKETDRLEALSVELAKMGIDTTIDAGSITVIGGTPCAASIKTYDDHRMAMGFSIMAAKVNNLIIEDPEVVTKSFPNFWEKLLSTGLSISV